MTKNEQIAYTAGMMAASYPGAREPRYPDPKMNEAFQKGKADREREPR